MLSVPFMGQSLAECHRGQRRGISEMAHRRLSIIFVVATATTCSFAFQLQAPAAELASLLLHTGTHTACLSIAILSGFPRPGSCSNCPFDAAVRVCRPCL